MSYLIPVTNSKNLIRALKKTGFIVSHQRGSHISLFHTKNPKKMITIPFNKDMKKGTLKAIFNQIEKLGINPEEIIKNF